MLKKAFTFFVPVPGIKADYHAVDFDNLYPAHEIVELNESDLRKALENLPCCSTNKDGTREGDPLNLVFIGSREDISAAFVRRVWLSPMRFQGKRVWIGQISRDIGVRFTFKTWPPVTHKIDPDIDDAIYALLEDLIYSQQISKTGWVKGVGKASRGNPRYNLTKDPYFNSGVRLVLVFERRPVSFMQLQYFDWEDPPASSRLQRLTVYEQQDIDGEQ